MIRYFGTYEKLWKWKNELYFGTSSIPLSLLPPSSSYSISFTHLVCYIKQAAWKVYGWMVLQPLAMYYLDAPEIVGGWAGKPPADICAQLTGTKSDFWIEHEEVCWERIAQNFHSWGVIIFVLIYTFSIYKTVSYVTSKYIFT